MVIKLSLFGKSPTNNTTIKGGFYYVGKGNQNQNVETATEFY